MHHPVSIAPRAAGSQRKRTGAARLLAATGQTGRVDAATLCIGALMVGDEANGPRLERSIRRRCRGRRIHSVYVGGGCPSELHRVQTWRVDRRGAGQPRRERCHLRGREQGGGSSAVRLGRARGDVASSGEGAEASAAGERADGRPFRPMIDIICRGLQLELRANPRCRALGSHAGGGGARSSKSPRLRNRHPPDRHLDRPHCFTSTRVLLFPWSQSVLHWPP